MIINITPAESPYTVTPDQFTEIINLKPDVTILCSGPGNVTINLPAISALPNGQGEVVVRLTDKGVDVIINTPDTFAGAFNAFVDESQIIIPANSQNASLGLQASLDVWNILT